MTDSELKKGIERDIKIISEYVQLRVSSGYEIESVVKSLIFKNYVQLNMPKFKRGIKHLTKLNNQ